MAKTMKALMKKKEGVSYDYADCPIPVPGDGELLVKVTKVSICGSDLNLYSWNEGSILIYILILHLVSIYLFLEVGFSFNVRVV